MSAILSVTEVRNAMRCPRVFALGRHRGKQVQFPITASSLGSAFHRLVSRWARLAHSATSLVSEVSPGASVSQVEHAVARELLGLLADTLVNTPAYQAMPAEVDDLAEALRQFAAYVVRQLDLERHGPHEALRGFLVGSEMDVSMPMEVRTGLWVTLRGRVDALHASAGRLDIVEYKLTAEENGALDRAQVALYRALFRATTGRDVGALILRFNPELVTTRLSVEASDGLLTETILPLVASMVAWVENPLLAPPTDHVDLCVACPLRGPCASLYDEWLQSRDAPPAGASRPRPDPEGTLQWTPPEVVDSQAEPSLSVAPAEPEAADEAARISARIVGILSGQGVLATVARDAVVGARVVTVELAAARGRVRAMDRAAEDVVHQLATVDGLGASYHREGGRRMFQVARPSPRTVRLPPLLQGAASWLASRPGRFLLGEHVDGRPALGDLGEAASCHLLVGGMTGSGKSVLLRALAASLVHYQPPSRILLTLVDPKRVSFGPLSRRLDAHLADPLCAEPREVIAVLEGLVEEMESRYRLLLDAGVDHIDEYHEVCGDTLPRRVVLMDEFQDLVADRATRDPFVEAVQRLGAKARAAGIHLVLATQRPDAKTVPGGVKANLPGKIALRVQSAINSRIVLDQTGAELLLGHGDLLCDLGQGLWRVQAPLVE